MQCLCKGLCFLSQRDWPLCNANGNLRHNLLAIANAMATESWLITMHTFQEEVPMQPCSRAKLCVS